eukprot:CAMPEP_0194293084 /NCGR_PEP_ID=MMETSP0169-20130528/47080_1 /TAXON_ID=218684 /ORGANISM="Corethron pennatum, Strain L29A3" /LENGTH=344 /DNA_ID=CAMNT_0039041467 /DNA_START=170 /DNA_END=1204 /DNA_ORIENTATION=-
MPISFNDQFRKLKNRFDDDDEDPSLEERATVMIPANVIMISGCKDAQTSMDVFDVGDFGIPNPAGKAGGACTSALLKLLYNDEVVPDDDLTYVEVLNGIRDNLDDDYTQVPQLSSSRPFNLEKPFVLAEGEGTRRALLIGINYVGMDGELDGCHNDVLNMKSYIEKVHGFKNSNISILMDDGKNRHANPTKKRILRNFKKLVRECEEGDSVFVHYSGHGVSLRDKDRNEKDGMDECLCPLDYTAKGYIRDDDIYSTLVAAMPAGVRMTCIMDCCHSGSILDLPYAYKAKTRKNGSEQSKKLKTGYAKSSVFEENNKFKFDKLFKCLGNLTEDFLDASDDSDVSD